MTIAKHNPTQQRQQSLSLLQALCSLRTGDLGLPVHSMPNSSRDPRDDHLAFLRSILEQALEIGNEVDDFFSEDSSPDNTDGEQEDSSRSQNQSQ
jgi:hypothetical protein